MNVNYAKFQKKFDSITISRELPQVRLWHGLFTYYFIRFVCFGGFVSLVSLVLVVSFRLFRFARFGGFGGFVSVVSGFVVRVLAHALVNSSATRKELARKRTTPQS